MYTRVQGPLYCGGCEGILNLIWIFSLRLTDIRLLAIVVLAPTKRGLAIGSS